MIPSISHRQALVLLLWLCVSGGTAFSQGVISKWFPTGTDDYALDGNWDTGFVPDLSAEERAVIDNGGMAVLSVSTVPTVGGADVTNGTLHIDRGGTLAIASGAAANGVLNLGTNGNLILGSLSGAGTAALTVGTGAILNGNVSVIGPDVEFSSSSFYLQGALSNTITTGGYSPLKSTGAAILAGPLHLTFDGVAPAFGSSWDLIDAAEVYGEFTQITSSVALPDGLSLLYNRVDGGSNGTVGRVSVGPALRLSVHRQTGEVAIQNLAIANSVTIDSYFITSLSGGIITAEWNSFFENGFTSFVESNPTANHVGELSLYSSRNIGAASNISLGNLFSASSPPLEVNPGGDLTFQYREASGVTRTGVVDYVGAHNNLVLVVNPDGQTYIQNQSEVDLNIDGYQIISPSGALNESGWTSLNSSDSNWTVSNPSDNHLGELNLTSSLFLEAQSDAVSLGSAFDVGGAKDLVFLYHRAGMGTLAGTVEYEDGVIEFESAIPGDYDKNGTVEAADYTKWRQLFGSSDPDADGNDDNIVNAADYVVWRDHFGKTSGGGSNSALGTAVPEPATWLLSLVTICSMLLIRKASAASHD